MKLYGRNKAGNERRHILLSLCFCIAILAVSLFGIIPVHEGLGNAFTMVAAIFAGIYSSRYTRICCKERKESINHAESR